MGAIRFEVWWSDTSREIIAPQLDQSAGDVIELIRQQVGPQLPEQDSQGHVIEYALFKEAQGARTALQRRLPLRRASLQADDQLYLANCKALWWASPTTSYENQEVADHTPTVTACRIVLAPHCEINVPPAGLQLDRTYLSDTLPRAAVAWENTKALMGRGSRLLRVSRERHCEIFHGEQGWMVRAHKSIYVGDKPLHKSSMMPLADGMIITLGRDGWPVKVHLDSRTD